MNAVGSLKGRKVVYFVWMFFAVLVGFSTQNAHAQSENARILLLSSSHHALPWQSALEMGFKARLRAQAPGTTVYFEYLDAGRFSQGPHLDTFADYLEQKYAPKGVDLILTEAPAATAFLIERPDLLAGAQRLAIQRGSKVEDVPTISVTLDFAEAITEMDRLVAPQKVFVVGDALKQGEHVRLSAFREAVARMDVNFEIEYILDEPMETLLPRLAKLPSGSAVFYLLTFRDGAGRSLSPFMAAKQITKASSAPVFTHWKTLMGSGVLGGYLISGEHVGEIAADVVLARVANEPWPEIRDKPFVRYYDWGQARRWGLNKSDFPADAEFMGYEAPLVEAYTWEVIAAVVAVLALSSLAMVLAVVNNQRREALRSLGTERKMLAERVKERTAALQESEEKYRSLFEASKVGFVLCRMDGSLVECNEAFLDIIGYSEEEALHLTYWDLTPKSFAEDEARQLQSLEETGAYGPYEKVYMHKDGHKVPVLLNGTKIKGEGGEEFIWSIVQDLTERNRLERTKREFVSTVSHELRTPLTSIRGSLGLILGGVSGEVPEKTKELLTIANNNAGQLISLVNDILDLEKLQSQTMEFHMEPFDLGELMVEAVKTNQGYSQQFDVDFRVIKPNHTVPVKADRVRITQVLANLLSNAAKFSPQGEVVEIFVERDGTWADVCVRDHGAGIAEGFKPHIFERFAQEDGSDQRIKGGTGLGLSICKTIMDRHGGEIYYENPLDGGTAFHIRLRMIMDESPAEEVIEA